MKKIILTACLAALSSIAVADSFWNHNGSIMRLVADNNERTFIYEKPSQKMLNAGVQKGTILFDGYKNGDMYFGTSTVYSKNCYGDMTYKVSGHVYSGPKVVLIGKREQYDTRYDNCKPTGISVTDKLVFTYLYSQ